MALCQRKARLFLLGCPNLMVVTDLHPLVDLFRDRSLAEVINLRLFRLKKTLQFRFTIKYLPGKRNNAADALSRFPVLKATPEEDMDQEKDISDAVRAVTAAALDYNGAVIIDEEMMGGGGEPAHTYGEGSVHLVIPTPSTQDTRASIPCSVGPGSQFTGQSWRGTFSTIGTIAKIVQRGTHPACLRNR